MRQIAYPAALGGCVFGAGASPSWGAEWSIAPRYSSSVDYDSNRRLEADGSGSSATVLLVDLQLKRALEDISFTLEPNYTWRRFTRSSLGNGDDRNITAGSSWVREHSSLNLNASYSDQSTLVTEVLETGIINGDTHRRATQTGASWIYDQTERRAVVAQLNYLDVSYYGKSAPQLPGYRYPSGSLGEQFAFSERGTFTLSAFSSRLQSDTQGNSSHEEGLQIEIAYNVSERTKVDASLGESRRVLTSKRSLGTDASVKLDHAMERGTLSFAYKRSLVPYGFGFLFEQQVYSATVNYPLTAYLDTNLSFYRTQADETAVLLHVDRHNYNALAGSVRWHPAETWSLGAEISGIRTQTPDVAAIAVKSWRTAVTLTWSPYPKSRSW